MRKIPCMILIALAVLTAGDVGQAQEKKGPNVDWQRGPAVAQIGDIAEIKLPSGYLFAGAKDAKALLESMENPTSGNELGFLATRDWFVLFEFSDIGYVKDDEKDSLDANAMLDSLRAGNDRANEERRSRGWAELKIVGWQEPPNYDPATNNLQWGISAESQGQPVVNYNTRILGRNGVMSVNLVTDPEKLKAALPPFRELLKGYSFKAGNKYGEYRQGDKLAAYGLAALVTGGAAAVALKTGLLQKLAKPLIAAFVALALGVKKLFSRKRPESGSAESA